MADYTTPDGRPLLVIRIPSPRRTAMSGPPPPVVIAPAGPQQATSGYGPYLVYEPYEEKPTG